MADTISEIPPLNQDSISAVFHRHMGLVTKLEEHLQSKQPLDQDVSQELHDYPCSAEERRTVLNNLSQLGDPEMMAILGPKSTDDLRAILHTSLDVYAADKRDEDRLQLSQRKFNYTLQIGQELENRLGISLGLEASQAQAQQFNLDIARKLVDFCNRTSSSATAGGANMPGFSDMSETFSSIRETLFDGDKRTNIVAKLGDEMAILDRELDRFLTAGTPTQQQQIDDETTPYSVGYTGYTAARITLAYEHMRNQGYTSAYREAIDQFFDQAIDALMETVDRKQSQASYLG